MTDVNEHNGEIRGHSFPVALLLWLVVHRLEARRNAQSQVYPDLRDHEVMHLSRLDVIDTGTYGRNVQPYSAVRLCISQLTSRMWVFAHNLQILAL